MNRFIETDPDQFMTFLEPSANVFCPTGEGGGIDPTCSPGEAARPAPKHPIGHRQLLAHWEKLEKRPEIAEILSQHFPKAKTGLFSPHGQGDHIHTVEAFDKAVKIAATADIGQRMRDAGVLEDMAYTFVSSAKAAATTEYDDDPYGSMFYEMERMGYTKNTDKAAAIILHSWAQSSDGENDVSLAMQRRAEYIFGIDGAYDNGLVPVKMGRKTETAVIDAGLQAIHARTQQILKDSDIPETVTLYRGYKAPKGTYLKHEEPEMGPLGFPLPEKMEERIIPETRTKLQPLSSFSSSYDVAEGFSGASGNRDAVVLAINVPRSKILSIPGSGLGCLYENEFVVMGGDYAARAYARNFGKQMSRDEFWKGERNAK